MKNAVSIHPTAIVETKEVGEGTRIFAYAHLLEGSRVGACCSIGDHCYIEAGAAVGDNCTIKNGNMLWEGVTLEDGVFVGPHVFFTNDLYPRSRRMIDSRYKDKSWVAPTLIKRGASLGAAAVILADVTVGEFAMVAAGAVVTKNVAAHALVLGNPARARGWVCRCGVPLKFKGAAARCACGLKFKRTENEIKPIS